MCALACIVASVIIFETFKPKVLPGDLFVSYNPSCDNPFQVVECRKDSLLILDVKDGYYLGVHTFYDTTSGTFLEVERDWRKVR